MRRAAILIALWLASASDGHAWGDQGHRVTGYIAQTGLSESTRAQLVALVGNDDLAQISTWMDDNRDALAERLPGSPRWHYENRTTCGAASRACDGEHCVTARIERYRTILRDPQRPREQRAEAVRILVHLVGDLHQPLHLADNTDRGGNELYVVMPGEREPRRLHEVWDSRVLRMEMGRRSAASYARSLAMNDNATRAERPASREVSVELWAAHSYGQGRDIAYGKLPGFACGTKRYGAQGNPIKLDDAYLSEARAVVADQLLSAGRHIAQVLNEALAAG